MVQRRLYLLVHAGSLGGGDIGWNFQNDATSSHILHCLFAPSTANKIPMQRCNAIWIVSGGGGGGGCHQRQNEMHSTRHKERGRREPKERGLLKGSKQQHELSNVVGWADKRVCLKLVVSSDVPSKRLGSPRPGKRACCWRLRASARRFCFLCCSVSVLAPRRSQAGRHAGLMIRSPDWAA